MFEECGCAARETPRAGIAKIAWRWCARAVRERACGCTIALNVNDGTIEVLLVCREEVEAQKRARVEAEQQGSPLRSLSDIYRLGDTLLDHLHSITNTITVTFWGGEMSQARN